MRQELSAKDAQLKQNEAALQEARLWAVCFSPSEGRLCSCSMEAAGFPSRYILPVQLGIQCSGLAVGKGKAMAKTHSQHWSAVTLVSFMSGNRNT